MLLTFTGLRSGTTVCYSLKLSYTLNCYPYFASASWKVYWYNVTHIRTSFLIELEVNEQFLLRLERGTLMVLAGSVTTSRYFWSRSITRDNGVSTL